MRLCRDSDKSRLEETTDELFRRPKIAAQMVHSVARRPEVAGPFLRSRLRRALHLTRIFSRLRKRPVAAGHRVKEHLRARGVRRKPGALQAATPGVVLVQHTARRLRRHGQTFPLEACLHDLPAILIPRWRVELVHPAFIFP